MTKLSVGCCGRNSMSSLPGFQCLPGQLAISSSKRQRSRNLCMTGQNGTTRRGLIRGAGAVLATMSISGGVLQGMMGVEAMAQTDSLESAVVPIVMCRTVLKPVRRYIEEGAWDKSRTSINYCTRVLALKKNIRKTAEFLDGDAYYDALNTAGELENIMTQLDATVYTPLFIPSDEGVSIEQQKYQQQAFSYYDMAIEYLDSFFTSIPNDALENARQTAKGKSYEIVVEAK